MHVAVLHGRIRLDFLGFLGPITHLVPHQRLLGIVPLERLVCGQTSRLERHESGTRNAKFFELGSLDLVSNDIENMIAELCAHIDRLARMLLHELYGQVLQLT